jgi:hypothetical protein
VVQHYTSAILAAVLTDDVVPDDRLGVAAPDPAATRAQRARSDFDRLIAFDDVVLDDWGAELA